MKNEHRTLTTAFIRQQKGPVGSELHRENGKRGIKKQTKLNMHSSPWRVCTGELRWGNSLVSEIVSCCKSESGLVGVD